MTPQDPEMQSEGPQVETFDATPEQQAQYEAAVNEALNVISDTPEKFESFMKAVSAGGDRAMQAVAMIVVSMIDAAEQKLGPIQDDKVIEAVAEALISEVYGMAVDEGALPQEVINEDVFAATYLEFAIAWAQANPDRMDEEDQAAMQEMMAERQAAQGVPGEQNAMAKGVAQANQQQGLISRSMA